MGVVDRRVGRSEFDEVTVILPDRRACLFSSSRASPSRHQDCAPSARPRAGRALMV